MENKGLKRDIINKFSGDLRKLFELEFEDKKLKQVENQELASIMGAHRKIKHVYLVVSSFESHQILGPLRTRFDEYKAASKLRFIDVDATMSVWGPKELAALGEVDEHTLFCIENRALIERVQNASTADLVKAAVDGFDAKFDDLKRRCPSKLQKIDEIAQDFRKAWAAAIVLDDDLAKNSLGLHQILESVRSDAARAARVKSMGEADAYQLIEAMSQEVEQQLGEGFGDRLGHLTVRIAGGVVAGLIGECPIEWREDHA